MCGTRCGDDGGEGEKERGRVKTGPLELRGQERKGAQEQHTPGHLEDLQEEERKPWG